MKVVKNEPEPVVVPPPTYTITLTEKEARTLVTLFGKMSTGAAIELIDGNEDYAADFPFDCYTTLDKAGIKMFNVNSWKTIKVVNI